MKDTLTRAPRVKMANEATLRDYFAAKAMEGAIFGAMKTWSWIPEAQHRRLATESYKLADATLAVREETK